MAELKFPDFAGENLATLAGTVITLKAGGSAVTNHRTFANAASDTNIEIAIDIIDTSENTATWRATYASGAGTLTRVSLEAAQGTLSTTSEAITVYASVPGRWFLHSTLSVNAQTPVSTDITGAVGQYYYITQSSQSANIDLTLPSANVGDRIGVYMVDGDDTYGVIIKGAASQTINGGSAATEWSRLFIKGENCIFRCVAANTWIVEHDGRVSCIAKIWRSTTQSIGTGWNKVLCADESYDVGSIGDPTTNNRIDIRRTGKYLITFGASILNVGDTNRVLAACYIDAVIAIQAPRIYNASGSATAQEGAGVGTLEVSAGSYCELYANQNTGTLNVNGAEDRTYIAVAEIL